MKKVFYLLLIFPLLITSCSSDDDYSSNDLVGTWVLEQISAKEVKTNNELASNAIKKDILSYNEDVGTITFSKDGTVISYGSDGTVDGVGTYSLKGSTFTLTMNGESNSTTISISNGRFSTNIDETEYYQSEISYLLPSVKNVVVSKVITTYSYKKK